MRVKLDRERCTGHALCVAIGGNVFDLDDQELVVLLVDETIPESLQGEARDAAEACPERAITIES